MPRPGGTPDGIGIVPSVARADRLSTNPHPRLRAREKAYVSLVIRQCGMIKASCQLRGGLDHAYPRAKIFPTTSRRAISGDEGVKRHESDVRARPAGGDETCMQGDDGADEVLQTWCRGRCLRFGCLQSPCRRYRKRRGVSGRYRWIP